MSLTDDPNDPRLTRGATRPTRRTATRPRCTSCSPRTSAPRASSGRYAGRTGTRSAATVTTMGQALAETYARNPGFYGATYCVHCGQHRPVGADGEFYWCDLDNTETQAPARQPKVGT
jgi:hypothetical protein